MDCRTCEPTLIDLVHSELATDAAREAHAHLATCASCRASFETLVAATRLAAQLPMVEPPPHIAPRVMELAQAHAREAAARLRVVAPRPTPWQALLDFVGRMATRPQFAMATVMVLIVAVGLWSLPRLRHEPEVAGGVVVNPEPEGEAAPSPGVEPAERLDLKVDMRAGRIRSKDALPAPASAAPAAPEPAAEEERPEAQKLAARAASNEDPLATLDDVDLGDKPRARSEAKAGAAPAKPAPKSKGAALDDQFAAAPPPAVSRPAAEPGRAAAGPSAKEEAGVARESDESSALGQRAQSLGEASGREAEGSGSSNTLSRLGSPTGGGSSAPSDSTSLSDRLLAARALAKQKGCAAALPSYQRVVIQAPSSAEAGSALIEMAQCRRNAGELVTARSLLERASNIPEVANRARALLAAMPDDGAEPEGKK